MRWTEPVLAASHHTALCLSGVFMSRPSPPRPTALTWLYGLGYGFSALPKCRKRCCSEGYGGMPAGSRHLHQSTLGSGLTPWPNRVCSGQFRRPKRPSKVSFEVSILPEPYFIHRPTGVYVRFLIPARARGAMGSRFLLRSLGGLRGDAAGPDGSRKISAEGADDHARAMEA
jgi:hypothetical protein